MSFCAIPDCCDELPSSARLDGTIKTCSRPTAVSRAISGNKTKTKFYLLIADGNLLCKIMFIIRVIPCMHN